MSYLRWRPLNIASERIILTVGILVGVLTTWLAWMELQSGDELDFHAYYIAGRAVREGESFVGWAITEGSFLTDKAYVYTPITAPLFAPYSLFPTWQSAFFVHTILLLIVFYGLGKLTIWAIESAFADENRELPRSDRWLILGFYLLSGPTVLSLYRGNIDPLIVLLLFGGFLAVERDAQAVGGTMWAIAAVFKLFPALLGIWLFYRRSYRAIAAALIVGLGTVLLSLGIFGVNMHIEFIEHIIHDRSREGAFMGGLSPTSRWITLRRPLSYLLPVSGTQLMGIGLALMLPFLTILYYGAQSAHERLATFTGTLCVLLITVVPATAGYVVYLVPSLLCLVYVIDLREAKRCFLGALVLINIPLYPQHIERILLTAPLPEPAAATGTSMAWTVLTYSSIGLWAFLLTLVGCVLVVVLPTEGDE